MAQLDTLTDLHLIQYIFMYVLSTRR